MTDPSIEPLDLLDTDYTNILANSSLPSHIPHPLLSCHNRFFINFYNQPSYILDNVQENHLGNRQSKMLKDPLLL